MGRLKKTPTERRPRPGAAGSRDPVSPNAPHIPKPGPPRPNKIFLAITLVLLAIWMGFLAVLAFLAHKWA